MSHPEYPKFKYHASKEPFIVHTAEEEQALGKAWKNSPADHIDPVAEFPQPSRAELLAQAADDGHDEEQLLEASESKASKKSKGK